MGAMGRESRVWPSGAKALRELRRGAAMVRTGGLAAGWRFLRDEVVGNSWVRLREGGGLAASRARVACNLCGWQGSRFLTHVAPGYVDRNAFCPRCRSYARHRAFAWLLEHELSGDVSELARGRGRRLLFAPEPGLAALLGRHLERLEGCDLDGGREGVSRVEDLQSLSLPDGSVDFAAAFHVLEHVPDDRRALRELARVLSERGRVLLCVPTEVTRHATVEFGAALPELNGHWREYGTDVVERCADAGLVGRTFRTRRDVPPDEFERLALVDEELHWLARADGLHA
jgi:SAM-dependent methyltransferase